MSPQHLPLDKYYLNTVKCKIQWIDGNNWDAMNELFHKPFPSPDLRFLTYNVERTGFEFLNSQVSWSRVLIMITMAKF